MKGKHSIFLVSCCLGGCVMALAGGCENLGDLTGGSKSETEAVALPTATNTEATTTAEPRPAPKEVWVDDDFNAHTDGWGYDHFSTPNDGVDAVASGGTVYVAEGWYPEGLRENHKDCKVIPTGTTYFTDAPPPGYSPKRLDGAAAPGL